MGWSVILPMAQLKLTNPRNDQAVNQKDTPTIDKLDELYKSDGVPLAIAAAQKAIEEAGIDIRQITHIVSTTCTNSSNPGFDHYVAKGLQIAHPPVYDLLGWDHSMIPDTEGDLGFDVHPNGWKVVLSPRVPKLTGGVVRPAFTRLMEALPSLPADYASAPDFDWAMHPGGATILSGAEKAMDIQAEHMRASYDTYINHGNSSSATIYSVMNRLRSKEMDVLAPGVAYARHYWPTNTPETESEGSRSEAGDEAGSDERRRSGAEVLVAPSPAEPARGPDTRDDSSNFIAEALENLELD
ncbi:unnamed protein product [Parascedosporium putredinis]|uniref:Chalcone/stilbene synthase C-terminal domain-containing protein n=1 Tax=Parascedosporium putredinis TaxID=1442378 RepID=A0A9P1MA65_9PEZI|nr:unnamed protein product [Parascedosporium putredinis]CAI7996065.1 unnamed protein product [Parascedosporium putredinis]